MAWRQGLLTGGMVTGGLYQRFDAPGLAARDRFEYWRGWYSDAIDVPMQLEPVDRLPRNFDASAESLTVGSVDLVEYRFGAAGIILRLLHLVNNRMFSRDVLVLHPFCAIMEKS